jgi:hypothetical protein
MHQKLVIAIARYTCEDAAIYIPDTDMLALIF